MNLTLNDFFCGAGGMGIGFQQAGFTIVGAWDFDKYAVESYKENVGDHVLQADISKMTWEDVPKADVWAFGFPCQDLSVAGKQAGMIKGQTRSGLFFEIMRLLEETRNQKPENLPSIIVAENVKALRKVLPVVKEEYEKQGYEMNETLYNSKYWGVPQNRERYFVAGLRNDINLEFKFLEQTTDNVPTLSSILETEVDEKYYMSDEKAAKIIEQALKKLEKLGKVHATLTPDRVEKRQNGRRAKEEEEEMFTLTAQDLHGVIQSVWTDKDDAAYCCDATYYKGTAPGDVGKSRRTQVIEIQEEPKLEMIGLLDTKGKEQIRRVYSPTGISPTLTAVQGGGHEAKILEPVLHVKEATKKGYAEADVGDSINISHPNSQTRRGRVGKQVAQTLMTSCEQVVVEEIVPPTFRVRKLTPREYARLQGFPDSFKFVVSNTQLYKQFGNAVTVNVAKAVATAIRNSLEKL
ncbi:DNA cytosine methyltransferase [Bacillota bacterium Lsc_1132]